METKFETENERNETSQSLSYQENHNKNDDNTLFNRLYKYRIIDYKKYLFDDNENLQIFFSMKVKLIHRMFLKIQLQNLTKKLEMSLIISK